MARGNPSNIGLSNSQGIEDGLPEPTRENRTRMDLTQCKEQGRIKDRKIQKLKVQVEAMRQFVNRHRYLAQLRMDRRSRSTEVCFDKLEVEIFIREANTILRDLAMFRKQL